MRTRILMMLVGVLLAGSAAPAAAEPLSQVFKRVNNAVVVVRTTQKQMAAGPERQLVSMPGLGSGVLISADGKVMTASHVVQIADDITVEFLNGELIPAKVVSSEPTADVALLQLARLPANAVFATLGDSEKVEVGEEVFIIGAPLGLTHTLTVGHISAHRNQNTVYSGISRSDFFQTDAAINPGNSGGPMFNMQGQIVGIVSHMLSKSGGFEGMGFVVTSDMARRILLERSPFWSGIHGYMLIGELARVFNLPQPAGLLVQGVASKSFAEQIGLRPGTLRAIIEGEALIIGGDILLEVQGIPIMESKKSTKVIREELSHLRSGAEIKVTILRDGKKQELSTRIP
ncbi:MAG: trypsin-like serine protease [Nitrospirae bacterium]|nr:MAG: trypsin-like serine protease [Nitrospirota bacterium]